MPQLTPEQARRVAAAVLEGFGTPADIAARVAGHLVSADLSGHPSHGIIRVLDYAARAGRGDLDPAGRPSVCDPASGGAVLVDGAQGYGHLAAQLLTERLVESAASAPVTLGGIVNASHTGRLGEWIESAAERGVVMLMCYASLDKSNVAAYGAREARLGTNPLAAGVPAGDGDALVMDFATSAIAGGRIQHLVAAGEQTPPDSLLDASGNATRDPSAWLDGGMLLPFGGHKGYGLSLLVSLLAGCVVGQAGRTRDSGVLAITVDPGAFAPRDDVLAAVREQLARMRTTPPRPGFGRVQVPGDYERDNRDRGLIDVPAATWDAVLGLGESLGVGDLGE